MESFLQWDPAQVLSYIKGHIGQDVSSLFIDNNIDGLLLPYITSEHLRELGIEPLATRLKIKKAIHLLIAGQQNSNHTSLGTPGYYFYSDYSRDPFRVYELQQSHTYSILIWASQ